MIAESTQETQDSLETLEAQGDHAPLPVYFVVPFTPVPERAHVVSHVLRSLLSFDMVFTDFAKGCASRCGECDACVLRMRIASNILADPASWVWEVWREGDELPVGIMYLTYVIPGTSAVAHYAFFDGHLADKTEILESVIRWCFSDHPEIGWSALMRLTIEIPSFAHALARHAVRRLGFGGAFKYRALPVEGVRRSAIRWRGEPHDILVLGRVNDALPAKE